MCDLHISTGVHISAPAEDVVRGSWLFLHRGVQLLAVLSLAGFILALVASRSAGA